jgi:signal transduction histidine kinase
VALCVISTVIGWVGQSKLLDNFAAYEKSEQTLLNVGELDRNVQELKARAEKYLNTGTDSQLTAAQSIQAKLIEDIANVQQASDSKPLQSTLDEMSQLLTSFGDQLQYAAKERTVRTQLVLKDLPIQYDSVENLIDQLKQRIPDGDEADLGILVIQLAQSNAAAYRSLQNYFVEPDAADFEAALEHIHRARDTAGAIAKQADSSEIKDLCGDLDAEIIRFKQSGTRAFQATRGYMYYANVVMAGEISEFVFYSNELKAFVQERRVQNLALRRVSTGRSRFFALAASLIAVGLAIWMATRLSYVIVSPISHITETFRKLGMGETVETIPALDREDEIGRMARAARVFNEKNQETRQLLQRSRQLTEELEQKAKALELTNQELDNFAYVASHDLKSPLRGILHLAQWVQEDCGDSLPDESRLHLQQMQKRVTKMERLLSELLDYSRAGKADPHPECIDIGLLIASLVMIIDKPAGFRIQLLSPTFNFYTVKTPLNQVLLNLITNGVKYNDKGRDGKIEIHATRVGDEVHFMVADNGRGIAPQHHSKVFEMYQRVSDDIVDGTGMGLAIVKKQVESHGGSIELSSEEGGGATFNFTWPCMPPPTEPKDETNS